MQFKVWVLGSLTYSSWFRGPTLELFPHLEVLLEILKSLLKEVFYDVSPNHCTLWFKYPVIYGLIWNVFFSRKSVESQFLQQELFQHNLLLYTELLLHKRYKATLPWTAANNKLSVFLKMPLVTWKRRMPEEKRQKTKAKRTKWEKKDRKVNTKMNKREGG